MNTKNTKVNRLSLNQMFIHVLKRHRRMSLETFILMA